jgi:two-component system response regulator HupR/HoxA
MNQRSCAPRAKQERSATYSSPRIGDCFAMPKPHWLDAQLAFPSMAVVATEVRWFLKGELPILVTGESGTGKTMLALALASASRRMPVIRAMLGCGDDLNTVTSELFGHERGAFTGATTNRTGLVEHANGGTLVLDELMNLPLHAQKLLLDYVQFGQFRPLGYGAANPRVSNARLISATNGDLTEAIRCGQFREDLYYRLAAVVIRLPPLRERRDEIPMLAQQILLGSRSGNALRLSSRTLEMLQSRSLHWPGNVRQLQHAIARAEERALACECNSVDVQTDDIETANATPGLPVLGIDPNLVSQLPLAKQWHALRERRAALQGDELRLIKCAMVQSKGELASAARALGIPRTTLASRLEARGLSRSTATGQVPERDDDESASC